MRRFSGYCLLMALCLLRPATAADNDGVAFFEQRIRPLLAQHCDGCHSSRAEKLRGGLLLDSPAGWQRGGDSGEPAIVPGQPDASPLIQAVRHESGLAMPPDAKLPAAAIADLVAWVRMGAPDPRTNSTAAAKRADKSWWSLQPLKVVDPPIVAGVPENWNSHAIDRFIAAKLTAEGLTPSSPADPRTLIRRMTYDVLGLPPTPAEVDAFLSAWQQGADTAVTNLVDRLLASPHYGEQWGRHWLDVVRFGESNGFERNVIIDDLWPFRDYVIDSLNADKPFDQFIIEHLAGDVVGRDQPAVEVGSAFLVAGPYDDVGNQDVVAQANIRAATLDDVITATAGAFLGLTVNCARCHHHKFDPVPTEDYYRMRAAFEGIKHGRRVVASQAEREAHESATKPLQAEKSRLDKELEGLEKQIRDRALAELQQRTWSRPKMDPQYTEERFAPVTARFVKFRMSAHTGNPRSAVGSRLTEFEVWTAGDASRNVALAATGARATGARAVTAEDFPDAYGPQFTIDGSFAEQWFVGNPAELVITLAQPEEVERIAFANSRGVNVQRRGIQGETPCEYEVQLSLDGQSWQTVADSTDREPWNEAHAIERLRTAVTTPEEREQRATLTKQIAELQQRLNAVPPLRQMWVGLREQPREPTRLHTGGDPMKPGNVVAPASLNVLSEVTASYELPPEAPEGERRRALARWIVAADNPLTPRVLANRVWQYHFGTGLVDTPSDFGFLGGRPTHPELLDWLAARLIAHGWRLKPLHREILLSQTYRQSSAWREDAAGLDRDARWLWRFPPRRLTGEELRDTLLSVAGRLDSRAGGPGFRLYKFTQNNVCTYFPLDQHGPETYRRAVYHQNARASVIDLLSDFDLPDNAFAAPQRANTTSPLQALTLLNHSFTLDMAAALAERAQSTAGSSDPDAIVDATYRHVLQRPPTAEERQAAAELVRKHGAAAFCRAILNLNEVLYVD